MFAYRPLSPGDPVGHAVVTDRFVCLLGDESDAGIAVELYRLLDSPNTTIRDVLDVFAAHGDAHRFAIVEILDDAKRVLHVAVRGDLAVDMSDVGSTRLSGPSGNT
ncbi:hypothetical protein BH11ACT3_BH11ACT3_12430 [soil metagenome]